MKEVTITYKNGTRIAFKTDRVEYKTEFGWLKEIGYKKAGKNRNTWLPIGGRRDDNNDYTGTTVEIKEA